jgi:Leucine-rich repeat (LRR) protein
MPASQYPYHPDPRSLQGQLPADLAVSTSLQRLELYGNTFSGPISALSNLTTLITLDLHYNNFDGLLPDLSKSAASLQYISLANNALTGSIPATYAQLVNLDTLGLAHNKLSGTLNVVNSLKKLAVIYMRNNSFTGAMPSIPKSAVVLDLDHNKLTSFPTDVCSGTAPGAYSKSGGCKTDWPTQPFDSCCLAANSFHCTKPPPCLALCNVTCTR